MHSFLLQCLIGQVHRKLEDTRDSYWSKIASQDGQRWRVDIEGKTKTIQHSYECGLQKHLNVGGLPM